MRRVVFVGLASLAGCAGILGFEDIVEDASDAAAPDAPFADSDARPAPDGGKRCSHLGRIRGRKLLASLVGNDPKHDSGERRPRLTADELTIVFIRRQLDDEGFPQTPLSFIARRDRIEDDFGVPERLVVPDRDAGVFSPSLTADGRRLYFVEGAVNSGNIVTYARDAATSVEIPGPFATEAEHPFFSAATEELFFARAKNTDHTFSVYRMRGEAASFDDAAAVSAIASGSTPTSYEEPVLSHDGAHLYYTATARPFDGGLPGSYVATRADRSGLDFVDPQPVPDVEPGIAAVGWVSSDECRVYTYRLNGGLTRIFVEEREPQR